MLTMPALRRDRRAPDASRDGARGNGALVILSMTPRNLDSEAQNPCAIGIDPSRRRDDSGRGGLGIERRPSTRLQGASPPGKLSVFSLSHQWGAPHSEFPLFPLFPLPVLPVEPRDPIGN